MKKIEHHEHLQISFIEDDEQAFSFLKFFIHQLLFFAMIFYMISLFDLQTNFLLAVIIGELMIVYLHVRILFGKWDKYVVLGIASLFVLLFILMNRYFMNGLFIVYEQTAQTLSMYSGRIMRPFELSVAGKEAIVSEQFFSVYLLLAIVFVSFIIVKIRSSIVMTVLLLVFVSIELNLQVVSSGVGQGLLFFVLLLMYLLFLVESDQEIRTSLAILISVVCLFGLLYGIAQWIIPADQYVKQSQVKKVEHQMRAKWENFRYEKEITNNFPQGDFARLEPLDAKEDVALEVLMSAPTSLYLRGFVGATYTDERWDVLDAEKYKNNFDMLYWLEHDAFHPMAQLSTLSEILDNTDESTNKVSIHNVGANSKYMYTPYELASTPKDQPKMFAELDQTFIGESFFGERNFTYDTSENLVTKYPTLANELYANRDDEAVAKFLTYESHYNEFVYDAYTDVPENIEMMLETHLGKVTLEEDDEHVPYEWAINKVTAYLEENIQYDTKVEKFQTDEDFLMQFLENERKGYAPHFATASTVMFRYFGIPARYVEGYVIPPEKVKDVEPYEKIAVDGMDAHAWTEIYIDEIGWIPVETTPGFQDLMGKVDMSNYPSGATDSDIESMYEEPEDGFNDAKQQIEDDSQMDEMNNEPKDKLSWLVWLLVIVGVLLLLALLVYIIYTWRCRMKLKKFIQSFYEDDVGQAMKNIFTYVLSLLVYDGIYLTGGSVASYVPKIEEMYGETYRRLFVQAWELHQLAMYSNESLTGEQRLFMIDFYKQSLKYVVAPKTFLQKMKMKYVDVAYDKL